MTGIAAKVCMAMVCVWSVSEAASTLQSEREEILRREADLAAGQRQYTLACSSCHGIAGEGKPTDLVPRLAGQHLSVIADQLVGFRQGTRLDGRMQGRASDHVLPTPQDMANVAAYAAALPGGSVERGPGQALTAAARLYASRCSECHGASGQGGPQSAVPRLAGQNYSYLVRQLDDFISGRRPAAAREHLQQLNALDQAQVAGIADHLSRVP